MRIAIPSAAFRVVARRGHFWASELLGIAVVGLMLCGLTTLGTVGVVNESAIRRNGRLLSRLKTEQVILSHTLEGLRQRKRIVTVLDTFSNGRLSEDILCPLAELVWRNSATFGYDPFLVLSVIHVESVFDPQALGRYRSGEPSGALGLMQLKFETAREVAGMLGIKLTGPDDLFKPEVNIPLGVAYLTQVISRFKSLKLGILAYNQGPGTVHSIVERNRPLSIRYYDKVLATYYRLKSMIPAPIHPGDPRNSPTP